MEGGAIFSPTTIPIGTVLFTPLFVRLPQICYNLAVNGIIMLNSKYLLMTSFEQSAFNQNWAGNALSQTFNK